MKKILLLTFNLFSALLMVAQTIVSTTQENKNVVLEEFTGIHCGYCPSGHAIAKSIQDAHPNDVVVINIHTGGYAAPSAGEPDFRTAFGTSIHGQIGTTSYPSGTVNRHVFSNSRTGMSRGSWKSAANTILGQSSYVNVAIEAEIDVQTRVMTVHVEAYYTSNSSKNTNKLNVVLLQNNTLGPQTGGGMGDEYIHMHRLVHMITGQWGEEIATTTQGTFIDKTYTYTIPTDYKGVVAELSDMEVAVFVAEGNQEIISGSRSEPAFINISTDNNAGLENVVVASKICGDFVTPSVKIRNMGNNLLTSVDISYNVGSNTDSLFHWSGNLESLKTVEFELGEYEFTPEQTNNLNIEIISINDGADEDITDNKMVASFDKAVISRDTVILTLTTDNYGSETKWYLYNSTDEVVAFGGPYTNNKTYTKEFVLPSDCYIFKIEDSYGDGGARYSLKDSRGTLIHTSNGSYGASEEVPFYNGIVSGIETIENNLPVTIYPNPVCDMLYVDFELEKPAIVKVRLYNLAGSLIEIYSYGKLTPGNSRLELLIGDIAPGMYLLVLNADNKSAKKKIVVVK